MDIHYINSRPAGSSGKKCLNNWIRQYRAYAGYLAKP